jgi:hypothetical protein
VYEAWYDNSNFFLSTLRCEITRFNCMYIENTEYLKTKFLWQFYRRYHYFINSYKFIYSLRLGQSDLKKKKNVYILFCQNITKKNQHFLFMWDTQLSTYEDNQRKTTQNQSSTNRYISIPKCTKYCSCITNR